jgi:hypothetical protein
LSDKFFSYEQSWTKLHSQTAHKKSYIYGQK